MQRLVFVEQFYYPEGWGGAQLPRDITMHLARSGIEVEVICGGDQYAPVDDESIEDPRVAGVRITRIWRLMAGDIQTAKLLRQLWFYIASTPLLLCRRSPEVFATQTNPPLVVPLVAIAAWLHRRPFVIIAQDLYPEVMFAHGMMRRDSAFGRVLSQLFRWAYARARCVVSLGPSMSKRLIEKGVKPARIACISNWATGNARIVRGDENRLRSDWGLSNTFVVLYSGNLGISHDVETPILAVREVIREGVDVRLVFVGKGSRLAEAQALTKKVDIGHAVQFRPFVSFDLLPHSIGLADVALVTLRDGFQGLVVPSKLLGYLARGVPTLYVGPESDVQQVLATSGGGRCFDSGDVRGLASELKRLVIDRKALLEMGAEGRRYYERKLSRSIGLESYSQLFAGLTANGSLGD